MVKRQRIPEEERNDDNSGSKKGRTEEGDSNVFDIGPVRKPMNSIPLSAAHVRPPRYVFIFGNGDMGQFGLGTTVLGDIARPRLHAWFESAVKGDVLGGESAGLECIAAGGMHTLAIDEAGKVWSWGVNDNASLGRPTVNVPDPDNTSEILEAEILETQPLVVQTLVDENFRAVNVAAGDSISVALDQKGQLRVWGSFRASDGLLGFVCNEGLPKAQTIPMELPSLSKLRFVQVACGTDHVLALTMQGTVYVWGNGQQAQLGRRIIERRKVNGLAPERLALRRIKLIGCGSYHSFAVSESGVVYAWGLNNMHQTGVSEDLGGSEDIIWTPTEVKALGRKRLGKGRRIVQISGGEHHTLFLMNDGSVYGCGRCDGSELGLPEGHPAVQKQRIYTGEDVDAAAEDTFKPVDEFVSEPTQISFPSPPIGEDTDHSQAHVNPMVRISAGTRHNLAVSASGLLYSWGLGSSCQLGLGSEVELQLVPTRVTSKAMEGWFVEDASAGGQHCVVLARKLT